MMQQNAQRSGQTRALSLSLLLVFLLAALLTACQPTPTEDIVVNKGDGTTIAEAPAGRYAAPERYTDELTFQAAGVDTRVRIDAAVSVPEVERYPVYAVSPAVYPEATARQFISACLDGHEGFTGCTGDGTTKAMAQRLIEEYQAVLEPEHPLWQRMRENNDYSEERTEFTLQEFEQAIRKLQDEYSSLPDAITGTPYTEETPLAVDMDILFDAGGPVPGTVSLCRWTPSNHVYVYTAGRRYGGPSFRMEWPSQYDCYARLTISEEEARQMADTFVATLGIPDLLCVASGREVWSRLDIFILEWTKSPVYVFVYTPAVDGVAMEYVDVEYLYDCLNWNFHHPERFSNDVWRQNTLYVFVSETGVECVSWQNAVRAERTATLAENAALLPFDAVMERFSEQIRYGTNFRSTASEEFLRPDRQTLTIDRIALGYACVLDGEGADSYRLVPVWDFFGSMVEEYDEPLSEGSSWATNENGEVEETALGRSFLTLNAIDGSVIDRIVGY